MITITFVLADGQEITVSAAPNYSLMEIALQNDIKGIDGACGGCMACATCHCYIAPPWQDITQQSDNEKTDEEADMLDVVFDERASSRLSCQIKITQDMDGMIVALPGAKCTY